MAKAAELGMVTIGLETGKSEEGRVGAGMEADVQALPDATIST